MEISYTNFDKKAILNHIRLFGKKLFLILLIYCFCVHFLQYFIYKAFYKFGTDDIYFSFALKVIISITSNILIFLFIYESKYKQTKSIQKDKSILIPLLFIFMTFTLVSNILLNNILLIFETSNSQSHLSNSTVEYILLILSSVIVPAVTEEFAFRRCILNSLRKYGDSVAIVVSSVCFGLLHSDIEQMFFAILCGLALGYIYIYTNSYTIVVFLHMINNGISLGFNILSNQVSKSVYNYIFDIFTILIIAIGTISFIYLSKRKSDFLSINSFDGNISFSERITALLSGIFIVK